MQYRMTNLRLQSLLLRADPVTPHNWAAVGLTPLIICPRTSDREGMRWRKRDCARSKHPLSLSLGVGGPRPLNCASSHCSSRAAPTGRYGRKLSGNTLIVPQPTAQAQRGIRSIMGFILASSGCPMLDFLKPLARFHQPLPTPEGTFFRAASMYLLAQYFISKAGQTPDFDLAGLKQHYENLQIVNQALAERLRTTGIEDATVNALVLLDTYAASIPDMIQTSLGNLKYLFAGYLHENG